MIDYSIIIPSKNLPDLLQRALDSIPHRDGIQVIVVDDASDPGVVDFSAYPGLDDPQVEVLFTKEARGAGYARNAGLARAAGRWTLFLDCDDLFTPGAFALLDSHKEDDADIVFFNVTSAYSDDLTYSPRHLARSEYFTSYDGARRGFCCRYLYSEPWGKMFRTAFLREGAFRFDETPLANDFRFSVMTGHAAGRIVTDTRPLVCVTERRGSLSHDFCSTPLQLSTRLAVYRDVQDLLDAAGVKSYPFYKLVNFTLRHRRHMTNILRDFCSDRRINYTSLRLKTLFYRILFSRWHRRHWAAF